MGYINQYINHAYNNITIHINHILTVYYQPMDPMGDVDPKKNLKLCSFFSKVKLEADRLMAFVEETSREHGRQGLDEATWN